MYITIKYSCDWKHSSRVNKNINIKLKTLYNDDLLLFQNTQCFVIVKHPHKHIINIVSIVKYIMKLEIPCFVCLMVFNATFNNISVISWWSVLLVLETGGPGENRQHVTSHWQTLLHNIVHLALIEIELTTSVVIGTDIGSCKSNYHTITATCAPRNIYFILVTYLLLYI